MWLGFSLGVRLRLEPWLVVLLLLLVLLLGLLPMRIVKRLIEENRVTGLMLMLGSILGIFIGLIPILVFWLVMILVLVGLTRIQIRKNFLLLPPAKLPQSICKFLDEEQMSNLIDYRISWYFQQLPNKWTDLKVLIKTYRFVLVVLLKKSIDEIIQFFKSGIPRI